MAQETRRRLRGATLLLLSIGLVGLLGCAVEEVTGPDDGNDPTDPVDPVPPPDPTSGTVRLAWDAPTTNADGSALEDLVGYVVYYGSSRTSLSNSVDTGSATSVSIELPLGTHFVGVKAYDIWRNESSMSNVIEVTAAAE